MDAEDEDEPTQESLDRRDAELFDLHLEALAELKADDSTLLALHPFPPTDLTALHEQHGRLQLALARPPRADDSEVSEVVEWFLAPDAGVPRYLRLTGEDYHRIFHYWLDVSQGEELLRRPDGDDEEEGEEDEEDEDDEAYAWEEQRQVLLRLQLFARMKEAGYTMRRELVRRMLPSREANIGPYMAMVLLRETAWGRLPRTPTPTASTERSPRMAAFDAAMRGEQIDWSVNTLTAGSGSKPLVSLTSAVDAIPFSPPAADDLHAQLLADGPLLEMVIDASADDSYVDAVRDTYPEVLSMMTREQLPNPMSAAFYPLTPAVVPGGLPHLALELLGLMELHSIPFTRRSTVTALLYVCNELQLPSMAALVVRKAHRDGIPITASLLDNLVTIACNSYHLHLALQALSLMRALRLEAPVSAYASVFNFATFGEDHVVDIAIIDHWARSRRLVMSGWEGREGGNRSALVYAVLEEAQRVGLAADEVVREAQLVVSRELVRSMKDQLRDIGQWIRRREGGQEDDEDGVDDADDDDGDDHST